MGEWKPMPLRSQPPTASRQYLIWVGAAPLAGPSPSPGSGPTSSSRLEISLHFGGELVAESRDFRDLLDGSFAELLDAAEVGEKRVLPFGPEARHLVDERLAQIAAA